jgi:hypothetical protein
MLQKMIRDAYFEQIKRGLVEELDRETGCSIFEQKQLIYFFWKGTIVSCVAYRTVDRSYG